MQRKKEIKNKIEGFLELPREIVSEIPKITLMGFNQMMIENYKGIVEYDENFIRLSTSIGNIIIEGFSLNLNQITSDDIEIKGKISHIEFEDIN